MEMTMEIKMAECQKFEKCNAAICPLDPEQGIHIKGDPVCCFIKDHLEGKDFPFKDAVAATEKVWRVKIGNSQMAKQIKARQRLRRYWAKNDQEGPKRGVLQGGMGYGIGKTINPSAELVPTPSTSRSTCYVEAVR